MAPTKRAAAKAPAEEPAAKKMFNMLKQRGVSRGYYSAVVDAVEHPLMRDAINEECRKMLVAMIPQGLCVPTDERHELQAMAVRMIGEVVSGVEAKLQEAVDAEAAKVAALEGSKEGLQAKVDEAETALGEAGDVVKACTTALADISKALLSAKTALSDREQEQREGDAAHVAAKAEHAASKAALEGDFAKLRDGEWEEGQAKNHYGVLAALVDKLGLDDSLTSALPSCMMKKPADRGSFDLMVLQQFEASLTSKVADLEARLLDGAPAAERRAAAVEVAKGDIEAATARQQEAATELSAAQEKQQQAAAVAEAAKAAVDAAGPEQAKAEEARAERQSELEAFQSYNVAIYNDLKDKVSKKQEEAVAEEAAKVPAEVPLSAEAAAVSGA